MKKLICTFLAFSLISNITAYALIDTTFQNSYEIGDGITYTHVAGTNSSGPQRANIIEYSPNDNVSPMVAYGSKLYGKSNILTVGDYVESLGSTVLGGVNGDFYTLTTGIPLGLVMQDGQIMSSDSWQNALGFKADGSAIIDRPGMDMKLYYNDTYVQVNYFNKIRTDAYVYMFDTNFSAETRVTTSGTDIILEKADENILTPTSDLTFTVVDIVKGNSSYPIGENQFILSIDDKLSDRVPDVEIGATMTLSTRVSNVEWNDVTFAVGGQTILIQDGVIQSNLGTSKDPRTAIGIKADGTIVTYEVDGRDSSFSNGLSLTDLAAEMYALGCVSAINLDGGGSSSVAVQFAGYDDIIVTNSPSEGSLRPNANFVFFVNNTQPTGELAAIHIYPENYFMLVNSTIDVAVKGVDENFYAVDIDDDFKTLTDTDSQIVDGTYTATGVGEAHITASYGDFSNTATVTVLDKVDSITVLDEENNSAISDLSINQGDSIDLKATALYKYLEVAVSDLSFKWEVNGDVGEIDENGIFTASTKKSDGNILVSYGNYSSTQVPVSIGLMSEPNVYIITDFESPFEFEMLNGTQSYSDLKVANGKTSTMIAYDFGETNSTILTTTQNIYDYDVINFKVLGDGSENSLYVNFYNEEGVMIQIPAVDSLTNTDYISVSLDIPSEATSFAGFSIKEGSSKTGTIYLDHITLSNEKNDNAAPIMTLSEVPTIADEVSITGTIVNDESYAVDKENISVTINGESKSFNYVLKDGEFSFNSGILSDGVNRITITAIDTFGNIATTSYDVVKEVEEPEVETPEEEIPEGETSDSETPESEVPDEEIPDDGAITFEDISESWAKDYINFAAQNGIVNGETKEGLWYFNPSRNLTRGEFAVIMSRFLGLETEVVVEPETIDEDGEIVEAVIETISANTEFSDLENIADWALPHVIAVSNAGIMNGILSNDGSVAFNSQNTITRAEVITVLGRIIDKGFETEPISFVDESSIPNWSYEHFETLINLGMLNGYTDGTIKPLNNITRAEVCKLIYMVK
ncbi:MAG: phosphodiester glycosidase family protein [Clostridia bacterium]